MRPTASPCAPDSVSPQPPPPSCGCVVMPLELPKGQAPRPGPYAIDDIDCPLFEPISPQAREMLLDMRREREEWATAEERRFLELDRQRAHADWAPNQPSQPRTRLRRYRGVESGWQLGDAFPGGAADEIQDFPSPFDTASPIHDDKAAATTVRRWRWPGRTGGLGLFRSLCLNGRPVGARIQLEVGGTGNRVRFNVGHRERFVVPAELPIELCAINDGNFWPDLEEVDLSTAMALQPEHILGNPVAHGSLILVTVGGVICGDRAQSSIRAMLHALESHRVLCVRKVTSSGASAFVSLSREADRAGVLGLLNAMGIAVRPAGVGAPVHALVGPERYVVGFDQMYETLRYDPDGVRREIEEVPGFIVHQGGLVAIEIGAADPTNVRFRNGQILNQPVAVEDYVESMHCNEDQVNEYVGHATSVTSMLISRTYNIPPALVEDLTLAGNDDPSERYGGFGGVPSGNVVRVLSLDAIAYQLDSRCRESDGVWGFKLTTEVWDEALHMSERWSGNGETQTARVLSVSVGSRLYSPSVMHGLYDDVSGDEGEVHALCMLTDEFCFQTGVVVVAAIDNSVNSNTSGPVMPAACPNVVAVGGYHDSEFGQVGQQDGVPFNLHAIESESLQLVSLFKPEVLGPFTARALRVRSGWDNQSYPNGAESDRSSGGVTLEMDSQGVWASGTSIATPVIAAAAKWIDSLLQAGFGASPELVKAVLFCCCRGYAEVGDVRYEASIEDKISDPGRGSGTANAQLYRVTGGRSDAVFGVIRYDLIGKFFRRVERVGSENWLTDASVNFCAGHSSYTIGADSGRELGSDVQTQVLSERGVQSVSFGTAQQIRFADTPYTSWERIGIVELPDISSGRWHTLVVSWRVSVDGSALSRSERQTIREHMEANEFIEPAASSESDLARIATTPLMMRLVVSTDEGPRFVASPDGSVALVQNTGLSLNSFVSGAPYRAFRFRAPYGTGLTRNARLRLELFWPVGLALFNIPQRIAVAIRGDDGDTSNSDVRDGGLRLERDRVEAFQLFEYSRGPSARSRMDFAALRPAWREHEPD